MLEEGLSGRTTVFSDPLHECMSGLDVIYSTLMSHEPVDLLIIMLGTNDTKERFNASPACIGIGMERLALKAETVAAWRAGRPNLLIVAPPHIGAGHNDPAMGASCHATSMGVAEEYRKKCAAHGWAFLRRRGRGGVQHGRLYAPQLPRASPARRCARAESARSDLMLGRVFRYQGWLWRALNTLTDILALSVLWLCAASPY